MTVPLPDCIDALSERIEGVSTLQGGVYTYVPHDPSPQPWGLIVLNSWVPYESSAEDMATVTLGVYGEVLPSLTDAAAHRFFTLVQTLADNLRGVEPLTVVVGSESRGVSLRWGGVGNVRVIEQGSQTRWGADIGVGLVIPTR